MLLGAVLGLLLLGGAGTASAHAGLSSVDPGDGAVLKSAPRAVTLTFTESVGLLDGSFRVLDPANRRVHTGEPQHADGRSDTARVTLPRDLGTGTFTVAWRVVSADSHPVSGAFTFSVGKRSATTAAVPDTPVEDPATGSLYDIARYGAYTALALLIGTAVFALVCRPNDIAPLKQPLLAGWWTLLATTLALLVLRGPYETGSGPATAFDPSALRHTLTSCPGVALLARLVLLAVAAALFLRLRRRADQARPTPALLAVGAALCVGLALTWVSAEHASAGIQVPLAMTSSILHLLAMAVWLGGLAALLITLYRSRSAAPLPATALPRFSRLAFTSVTVLTLTGIYQSWRGLGSWHALTSTSYGGILIAKLCAVALMLAAAGVSRRWTARLAGAGVGTEAKVESPEKERVLETVGGSSTAAASTAAAATADAPSAATTTADAPLVEAATVDASSVEAATGVAAPEDAPPPVPLRGLRRSVLAEVAVGIVVLVITTVLTGTLPGRAATEASAATGTGSTAGEPTSSTTVIPFDVGTPNGHGTVQITLEPSRVGENTVQAVVFGPDGGVSTVPELRLTFTLADQKIGPLDADLTDQGGYWGTEAVNLPFPGTWTMKVTVRVSELDQVTASKTVRIVR
ncbi:copper resistance CopC/CopD family protein [Streptomyces sp. SAS_270]|uniref:copper resistance CopC/CopD family protein n=1 Tax=Streptomyces sp. SAS_270 TaxID=3412748 RepID=UPI00403C0540